MAHNRSAFIKALDRSEARRDGGYKHSWGFSFPADSEEEEDEEERRHESAVVSLEEMDRHQLTSPDGKKSPNHRNCTSIDSLKTHENQMNNHVRPLPKLQPKRLSSIPLTVATPSTMSNRNNYVIITRASPQEVILQGRQFDYTQVNPTAIRKTAQRNSFSIPQQRAEVDNITLTCPEITEGHSLNTKRRVQQKRKPLEGCSFSRPVRAVEPIVYHTVCMKCHVPSEDVGRCQKCGSSQALLPPSSCQQAAPTPRPSIRPQPSPGPNIVQENFYKPAPNVRVHRGETVPVRVVTNRMSPLNNGRAPLLAGTSGYCASRNATKGTKVTLANQQRQLNDPIVLSSDEEDEADNASTGSVNRLDSVSPRPADSAHSSPAPSGGRVEAAVKSVGEQEDLGSDFFEDVNTKITIPRRARMKDQFGNQIIEYTPRMKKPRFTPQNCDSIILECRSVRVGTLRRMVTKPVIFSTEDIQLETEGAECGSVEKVCLQASELISCEWCNVRKLPVLFFQTTQKECLRLRTQLNMEKGGHWYDCSEEQSDEKYIVLIFENGLGMKEQMILEDILGVIGDANKVDNFPAKLSFEEANIRLVNYNKASRQKEEMTKPVQTPPKLPQVSPVTKVTAAASVEPVPVRTRMATRQQDSSYFEEEEDDMTDLQPTFTGPVVKLMVYPPPPAKCGISVTNEDLHCLNDGEFLNDVIIDFYLKYLVLEKLKKEDAQRIHVFSSFFYKRLNQRERRNSREATSLPLQKRKHNRVKTWTRHVDLFQKDFIFVPINESAHWYLAVICFPGLDGPLLEQNPLYLGPHLPDPDPSSEENIPDHCRPLSPDADELGSHSEQPSPGAPEGCVDHRAEADCTAENSGREPVGLRRSGPVDGEQHYTTRVAPPTAQANVTAASGELHRISICYGSTKEDDAYTFSDDQSSCQDDCSEDGNEDAFGSDTSSLAPKATVCRQPCILIMDSLRGPTRSTVVKTLREYLEVEWEARKGTQRSFGKDVMKGSSPRVPQQDNFSDCGVYVLQYVESFFENPIPSFHLPVNLSNWFPQQRMKTKREEIRELILKIQAQQEKVREELEEAPPPGSSEEPEIEEMFGSRCRPPHLPISP
ncbi:sentrin-specific protease 6 isoform 2-T2 [Pholidichthys leucotaenia]